MGYVQKKADSCSVTETDVMEQTANKIYLMRNTSVNSEDAKTDFNKMLVRVYLNKSL